MNPSDTRHRDAMAGAAEAREKGGKKSQGFRLLTHSDSDSYCLSHRTQTIAYTDKNTHSAMSFNVWDWQKTAVLLRYPKDMKVQSSTQRQVESRRIQRTPACVLTFIVLLALGFVSPHWWVEETNKNVPWSSASNNRQLQSSSSSSASRPPISGPSDPGLPLHVGSKMAAPLRLYEVRVNMKELFYCFSAGESLFSNFFPLETLALLYILDH